MYVKIETADGVGHIREFEGQVHWYCIPKAEFENIMYEHWDRFLESPGFGDSMKMTLIYGSGQNLATDCVAYIMSDSGQTIEILRPEPDPEFVITEVASTDHRATS